MVCRRGHNVYLGLARTYGPLCGNLRHDGAHEVLAKALVMEPIRSDSLYSATDAFPRVHDLAAGYGDPHGTPVYRTADDMQSRWLDLAQAECRRY